MRRRVFSTSSTPFLLLREMTTSSVIIDEAVWLLSSTIVDVQKLEVLLAESSISLPWCAEATNLFRKVHSQFLMFVEKSIVGTKGTNCVDEYLKETLNVLDLCNLLKSALLRMGRHRLMVDYAATHLHDDGKSCKTEFERLEYEINKFNDVEKWSDLSFAMKGLPKSKSKDSFVRVTCAFKGTFSILFFLIFSAIFHPNSMKVDGEEVICCGFPQLKSFSSSLRRLVTGFHQRIRADQDSSRPVLVENKEMEKALLVSKGNVGDMDKFRESVDLLCKSSLSLKEGLGMFECVVNQLFDEVVKGRNSVLNKVNIGQNLRLRKIH